MTNPYHHLHYHHRYYNNHHQNQNKSVSQINVSCVEDQTRRELFRDEQSSETVPDLSSCNMRCYIIEDMMFLDSSD